LKRGTLKIIVLVIVMVVVLAAIAYVYFRSRADPLSKVTIESPESAWTQQEISFKADNLPQGSLQLSWDFGDGETATGPLVSHSFFISGNRTVSLTVSDGKTTREMQRAIEIFPSENISIDDWGVWNSSGPLQGMTYVNVSAVNDGPESIEMFPSNLSLKSYQYGGEDFLFPPVNSSAPEGELSPSESLKWTSFFNLTVNWTPFSVVYCGWLEVRLPFQSTGNLTIYFIDVGQGDSFLIQTPEGKSILIDAGDNNAAETVTGFLTSHAVATLEALIITHPDSDHLGGADEVLETFEVLSVYHPGYERDTVSYTTFISAAEAEGCPILTDENLSIGEILTIDSTVRFQVLSIDDSANSSNNAGIVLKMSYGSFDCLFCADIDTWVEQDIISTSIDLDVELLKISHHGSRYASSNDFLNATTPDLGVISVGEDNPYGHPAPETLQRLTDHDVEVLRTDILGTITISTNGSTCSVC